MHMLFLISTILFAIGILLLALSAALLALRIFLWVVLMVFRGVYLLTTYFLEDKAPEPIQVHVEFHEEGAALQDGAALTFTRTKAGTWVLM